MSSTVMIYTGARGGGSVEETLMDLAKYERIKIIKKIAHYDLSQPLRFSSMLKRLNPQIWGYKGLIYKQRVDVGGHSYRILFCVVDEKAILLHLFMKTTRKTPRPDGKKSVRRYERLMSDLSLCRVYETEK